jgi:branched-chain amino acid transport system ATP-binding protein
MVDAGGPLLSTSKLVVRFGGVTALDGIDFELPEGLIWGVIGPNGAGKTTFVNAISGLIPATSGSMSFAGHRGGPWPIRRAVRLGIARTFQQTRAFLGLTVRQNLAIAMRLAPADVGSTELAREWRLTPDLDRVAGDLPYAILRRLGIALALATRPRLLLLDEPAVGLTGEEVDRMEAAIRAWNDRGVTVLLIEHNVRFLMRIAHRVSVFDRGRILFEGSPAECQSHPEVIEAYLGRRHAHAAH